MSESLRLTRRIVRRKRPPPACRKCGIPIGPHDDGWHRDAETEHQCKWCYTATLRKAFKDRGRICYTCKFCRMSNSFGGRGKCPYRKRLVSICQPECRRWRMKKPMED